MARQRFTLSDRRAILVAVAQLETVTFLKLADHHTQTRFREEVFPAFRSEFGRALS